ncbi:MAG: hypothetical protein LCH90_16175, partial [Proteobacteria bacterium]|nr:hypothetical protein [Pseudomonadota bacterium]
SPDGIASACSQKSEVTKWIKVHQDADPQEVVVRNREFLPAFAISGDGAVRALHPDEWSFCIDEINCLGTKLKGEEAAEGENLSTWRRQAIEKLPAGAFVWLDDFKRWLADNACSDIDEQILDDDPVVEPTLQPLVPSDLETVLFEGFRAAKPQDGSATSSFSSLTSILAGWFETPADDLPSEQWYRIRTASWLMLWDKLSPSQRREVALQWDYLHDPSNAVEREQAWEAFCQLDQIRKEIREWECLNPQSITEKAEQTDRLLALREQERLLRVQLSSDPAGSAQEDRAQQQGEAEAVTPTLSRGVVATETKDFAQLGRKERQIMSIVECARSCGYEPLLIPRGGKKQIKERCLQETKLFTDSAFDDAWKQAIQETPPRIRMKDHDMYGRRI